MKKICIITMGNIYVSPYITSYSEMIDSEFSIICWNRDNIKEDYPNAKIYSYTSNYSIRKGIGKIRGYLGYRKYIKKVLLEQDFDTIVLLQTWCAILLNFILVKRFRNNYIVEIRDYTYERCVVVRILESIIFKHAGMCVISSEGYKSFLPKRINYFTTHNIRDISAYEKALIRRRSKAKACLNIAFIGVVAYQDQNKKLIMALKNDSRFRLSFIGTRALELEEFCKENGVNNVILSDTFNPKDIMNYYRDADIVNNLYGNNTPTLDYALSNKLYFAAELGMPILVCPNTYMETITKKYSMDIVVDDYGNDLGDYIWNKYQGIDWESLDKNCDELLCVARREQKAYLDKISEMIG